MDSRPQRKRKAENKYPMKQNFLLRLWYTTTNTYSESMYVNNAQLYKYSDDQKAKFKCGTVITLKENNESISGVILARGTFEAMERLTPVLEDLANKGYDTDDVLCHIYRVNNASGGSDYLAPRPAERNEVHESVDADESLDESVETDVARERKWMKLLLSAKDRQNSLTCMTDDIVISKAVNNDRRLKSHDSNENSSTKQSDTKFTSNLISAELRVQTTILQHIDSKLSENNQLLRDTKLSKSSD